MKQSIYNSIVRLSDKYNLLYNALSDAFIIMSDKLTKLYNCGDAEEIKTQNLSFYTQLKETGCLVSDDDNELVLLQKMVDSVRLKNDEFHLIVNPTIDCNFRCWYCYESHVEGSQLSEEVLRSLFLFINNIINTGQIRLFKLSFFGGEPFLYYDEVVLPIIQYLKQQCDDHVIKYEIFFTTNGYLLNENRIQKLYSLGVNSFQITLDGNRCFHNKVRYSYKGDNSYDKILDNVFLLLKYNLFVVLRINYTFNNLHSVSSIYDDVKSIPLEKRNLISFDFQRVWQEDVRKLENISSDIDSVIHKFRSQGFCVSHKVIDMVRFPCYADCLNQVVVNFDGSIYKCTARDFNNSTSLGFLDKTGSILWNGKYDFSTKLSSYCLKCRIAPLCGSGCFQRKREMPENMCYYGYSEKDFDRIVLDRFCDNHAI